MYPKYHALWGFLASLILINYFNVTDLNALIFWMASWFIIDLDHAIRYTLITKNINPFNFFKKSVQEKERIINYERKGRKDFAYPVSVFHSIEVILILAILSKFYEPLFFIALGFVFHLLFDWFDLLKDKLDVFSKVSPIYTMIRNKNKKSLL